MLFRSFATALDQLGADYYDGMAAGYLRRRDLLGDALARAGFRCTLPEGAYYILADFSGLSDLPDTAFAEWLARERGVAPVPGSSFFSRPELGQRLVRFVFCKTDDLLVEAAARLQGRGGRDARDVQR